MSSRSDHDPAAKGPKKHHQRQFFSCRNGKVAVVLLLLTCLIWSLASRRDYHFDAQALAAAASRSTHGGSTSKPRIAIVTFVTSQNSYLHLSLRNKAHYTKHHGYDLVVDYESHAKRGTTWLKFDMIERLINEGTHDWIWWMDFDTLITNMTMPVSDIIEESLANATNPGEVDFLVTNDCNNLNDGSFLTRSSPRSVTALNAMRALHDQQAANKKGLNDQEAMRDFIKGGSALAQHVMRIPQWKINAFPEEIGCFDGDRKKWARGMLMVHFAGAWAHVKEKDPTGWLMKKYAKEIVYEYLEGWEGIDSW